MAIMSFDHHWVFTFGILGNIVSFLVFLAPVTTFYRVWKKKSTEGFHSLPYLVALFSSMLWLYYATLKKDAMLLITVNSFGCVVEIIYITLFITYAPKEAKNLTLKVFSFMNVGLFSLIFLVTQFAVKSDYKVQVLGWICVAISVSVFAAPLSIVAQVIRTKSVEFMPFTLSFFLTLSAVMWFAYGLFLKDICIAVPNVLGFILGLVQMILYAVYRRNYSDNKNLKVAENEKLPEHVVQNMVVLNKMPSSDQIFPVDTEPKDIENQLVVLNKEAKVTHKNCE